jgi:hypothetical protein
MGLKGKDSVELLGPVAHIQPLAGFHTFRNPEETVETHHMVNAKHASMLEVMPQTSDIVAIALLPKLFGMQGWKFPVLAARKDDIGRCPCRSLLDEQTLTAPDIVAVGMHTERQVKVQPYTLLTGFFRKDLNLLVSQPLPIKVVALSCLIVISIL